MTIRRVLDWIETHRDDGVRLLLELLRFPTVSAQSVHADDMRDCAEWLIRRFQEAGATAEILPADGHPAVFAEAGPPSAPVTLLVYGHYDVQPADDIACWHSPPFEPTVRNGAVYGRGAADDKGQLLTHVLALQAWTQVAGGPPIRVKYLVEGEEEIGSVHLSSSLRRHRDRLNCNFVALSDTAKLDTDTPALTWSTRGLVYKQLDISGPRKNLHSGIFGGTVANPLNELAGLLASLRDSDNRIAIPGFYDDVRQLTPAERHALNQYPFDEAAFLKNVGSPSLAGEAGYTTLERRGARPSLDINGICGGYTGEGAATIIPSSAFAKVSMRLVADQDPATISRLFDEAVRARCPASVRLNIRTLSECAPYVCPLDSAGAKAALAALEKGYGRLPAIIREGGSLPILPLFRSVLGADSLMLGFCMPDCNAHSANEFFHLRDLELGTRSSAILLDELARAVR